MTKALPDAVPLPDTLLLVLVLLPGFVSEGVVRYYGTSPQLSEVETVASALVFTLFDLVAALALWRVVDWARGREGARIPLSQRLTSLAFLSFLLATAVVVGAIWVVADSRDWLFKIPLTSRTSRADVWDKTFDENARHSRQAIVTLVDGRVLSGAVRYSSEGETDFAVFLRPAFTELLGDGSTPTLFRCAIVGGVLVPKAAIQTVAFRDPLKQVEKPCTDAQLAVALRGLKEP